MVSRHFNSRFASLRRRMLGGIALAVVLALASPAVAVIEALLPLSQLMSDSQAIVLAKIDSFDPQRHAAVVVVVESLQGKTKLTRLTINCKGDDAKQGDQLAARLKTGLPLVLFVTEFPEDEFTLINAYTNGSWFQVIGRSDGERLRWAFTHVEPYLPRTYRGTTDQLTSVLRDAIAGKRKPPGYDKNAPTGLGPTIAEQEAAERRDSEK